ncbi:tripartite motif-containing protein 2-like [Ptychodera flava]|uniref:tripartite motif-containing protein 2-like n=1 Tax=Ptychodera flava TaxID=63121 RepID=UPI00396A221E
MLQQLLQCPMCERQFQRPVILPCFHLACRVCVADNLECVICDKEFDLPDGAAKGLPNAHFIEHLVKRGGKSLATQVLRLCQDCQTPAVHYCASCGYFLCDRCKRQHKRFTTKIHDIKSIDDYKRESKNPIPCPAHPEKRVELVCNVCRIPVCSDCTIEGAVHQYHDCIDLWTGLDAMVQSDSQVLDEAGTRAAEMDGNLEFLRNTKHDLIDKKEKVSDDIRNHVDSYLKAVWNAGQQLLDEVNGYFDDSISVVSRKLDRGYEMLADLEGFSHLAEGLFQPGDSASRFFLARQCNERVRQLLQTNFKVAVDEIKSADFVPNREALASVSEMQLGSIQHHLVPIPKGLEGSWEEMQNEVIDSLRNNAETSENNNLIADTTDGKRDSLIIIGDEQTGNKTGGTEQKDGEIQQGKSSQGENSISEDGNEKAGQDSPRGMVNSEDRLSIQSDDSEKQPKPTVERQLSSPRTGTPKTPVQMRGENDHDYYIPGARERNTAKHKVRENSELGSGDSSQSVKFCEPHGIAVSPSGNIAIADTRNGEVKLFNGDRTFTGSLKIRRNVFLPGKFSPFDVAFFDEEHLVVSDCEDNSVVICNLHGKVTKRIEDTALRKPRGVVVDSEGRILVVDSHSQLVRVYCAESGQRLLSFGSGDENSEGQLADPWFIAVDNATNVLVSDSSKSCLQVFDQDGYFLHRSYIRLGSQGRQRISPCGLHCDREGNVYITRYDSGGVYAFDANKRYMFEFGESWQNYFGVAVDIREPWRAYVTDKVGHSVYVFQSAED